MKGRPLLTLAASAADPHLKRLASTFLTEVKLVGWVSRTPEFPPSGRHIRKRDTLGRCRVNGAGNFPFQHMLNYIVLRQ